MKDFDAVIYMAGFCAGLVFMAASLIIFPGILSLLAFGFGLAVARYCYGVLENESP